MEILFTLLGFFAIVGTFLILHYTVGKKYKFPAGTKVDGRYKECKTVLVYGKDVKSVFGSYSDKQISNGLALALWSLQQTTKTKLPSTICVHILNDDDYSKTYDAPASELYGKPIKSNGMFVGNVEAKWAQRVAIPLVAIRSSVFASTPKTGSLVIHEMVHWLVSKDHGKKWPDIYDAGHSLKEYWVHKDEVESLEEKAQAVFVAHRDEIF